MAKYTMTGAVSSPWRPGGPQPLSRPDVTDRWQVEQELPVSQEQYRSLAIDDFGTGYSSLGQLRHFPFDSLKVDRSFMRGLGQDQTNAAIVSGVIALARNLVLAVVGEGIETRAQLEQLQALGCDRGQGYYLARPLTPEALRRLLVQDARLVPPAADQEAVA